MEKLSENKIVRNQVEIDKIKVKRIIKKVLFLESENERTKDTTDREMIDKHINIIKEELDAY